MQKTLKDRAKEFSVRLPFMDGREKGKTEELMGLVTTINDYGFLPNEDGEVYVAFTVKEIPGKFFFGGAVLTDRMSTLDGEGFGDEIRRDGLPVLMKESRSKKSNRTYTNVEFFPEG